MTKSVRRSLRSIIARLLVWAGLCSAAYCSKPWLKRHIVFNITSSLPRGLYIVDPNGSPQLGDLVMLKMPMLVRTTAQRRGYLPPGLVNTIKPVGAMEGDHVCVVDRWVVVN